MNIDLKLNFQKFLYDKDIVILDSSKYSRERIKRNLLELGAVEGKIKLISNFEDFKKEISRNRPGIIVSKHGLNEYTGYDAFNEYKKLYGKKDDVIFVLTTSNTSQMNISRACEEDIDVVIIKPYEDDQFIETFMHDISHLISPVDYIRTIEEGKEELFAGNLKEARIFFEKAQTLEKNPALACYFIGQVNILENILDHAEDSYKMGISYNDIHFKCLVALYELLKKARRVKDSYEILKKLFMYFPANPKRINEFVHMSIATQNYGNIESIYEVFSQIDMQTPEMKKYISAAFITIGQVYGINGDRKKMLTAFNRVVEISESNSKFLRKIIEVFAEYEMQDELLIYFDRFIEHESVDYKISEFLLSYFRDSHEVGAELGTSLIKEYGVINPVVFKCLYKRNKLLKNFDELNKIKQAMIEHFPKRFKFE